MEWHLFIILVVVNVCDCLGPYAGRRGPARQPESETHPRPNAVSERFYMSTFGFVYLFIRKAVLNRHRVVEIVSL